MHSARRAILQPAALYTQEWVFALHVCWHWWGAGLPGLRLRLQSDQLAKSLL